MRDKKGKGKSPDRAHGILAEPEGVLKDEKGDTLYYRAFRNEAEDLEGMMKLIEAELSEPYVSHHPCLPILPCPSYFADS